MAAYDNAGDARRHLVLKLEDIFERTVETVCPQMRPVSCKIGFLTGFRYV